MESLKTKAIVLKRTNYGEADRILNILTPEGKVSVMAKGVRKEKSKLAGGIELFSVSDVVIHRGKSSLGVLTSVRLVEFYGGIMKDLEAMELAGDVLKETSRRAEQVDAPEYFDLVWQVLKNMDEVLKTGSVSKLAMVRAWWGLNVARVSGEDVNLRVDVEGRKLAAEKKYAWNIVERALEENAGGEIDGERIKMMRLMVSAPLKLVLRVEGAESLMGEILHIVKCV